jgi:Arc/MetJ-type ribon-helix-helix transcriptional regulator
MDFEYTAAAELFIAKRSGGPRGPLGYRRFASAAEAIRFAVEELPSARILGAFMQIGDERFDAESIRSLYEHRDYPLERAERSQAGDGLTSKPVRR